MLLSSTHGAWVFTVLILLCNIQSYLAGTTDHGLGQREVAPSKQNMTLKGVFKSLVSFFKPTTCRISNEQRLIPCNVDVFSKSACLENHCCPIKIGLEVQCYMPAGDNVQLAIRLILLTGGGFLILGFLPICCCAILQRSPCINPLQRMSKKVQQLARKRGKHGQETKEVYYHLLD